MSEIYYHPPVTDLNTYIFNGVKRWVEMVIQLDVPIKKNSLISKVITYGINDPIQLSYINNGVIYDISNSALHNIDFTIVNDKLVNEHNLNNTLLEDIKINSLELESPDYGFKRIPIEKLVIRIKHNKSLPIKVYPVLRINTVYSDNRHLAMYIPNEFTDIKFLTNPEIMSSIQYNITGFGYHKTLNNELSVDSVILKNRRDHKLTFSHFKQSLILNRHYLFEN